MTLKVTQGHRKWHDSIGHLRGVFDYRIRIRIHSESRFRFTWQVEWLRRV